MLGTRVFRSKEPRGSSPVDEGLVVVPVLGTRVFKSKEPRGSLVDEGFVVGTLGGEKPLHSSTPPSLLIIRFAQP